jgi:hypothetical protein
MKMIAALPEVIGIAKEIYSPAQQRLGRDAVNHFLIQTAWLHLRCRVVAVCTGALEWMAKHQR